MQIANYQELTNLHFAALTQTYRELKNLEYI